MSTDDAPVAAEAPPVAENNEEVTPATDTGKRTREEEVMVD